MAIILSGTGLADFNVGPLVSPTPTINSAVLSPYVQEGIQFNSGQGYRINFAAGSTRWFSFYIYNTDSSMQDEDIIRWRAPDGTLIARMRATTAEDAVFQYFDAVGSAVTINSQIDWNNSLYRWDFEIDIADSGGAFRWYVDGVLQGEFTGDTLLRGQSTVDEMEIRDGGAGSGSYCAYSAIIIADEDTTDLEFEQLRPSGAGTLSDWTGDLENVAKDRIADANFMYAEADGDEQTFALDDSSGDFSTGYEVVEVRSAIRALGNAGALRACIYEGTTLGEGSTETVTLEGQPFQAAFPTNPDTGLAWTHAELNSMEIGFKRVAAP